jgi:hypothetical protein
MSEDRIIKTIEHHLAHMTDYSSWTVGATSNPDRCRRAHGDPVFWCHWHAETQDTAERIQKRFGDKGMKETPDGEVNPTYVYIF